METIANRERVLAIGTMLAIQIPILANMSTSNRVWTRAVYEALKAYSRTMPGWQIYPPDKCYTAEYLCDFTLFEDGYGRRIACESQWSHWAHSQLIDMKWAFDKLRGVKADIKIFIFEGEEKNWKEVRDCYLKRYAQLSTDEAFIALHWKGDHFEKS